MTHPDSADDESRRRAIVIAGMHRSGTSALAGTLHALGAALPEHLIPPNANNPSGYFESEVLYPLHDQLLNEAGSGWNHLRGPAADWFESEAAARWVDRLAEVSRDEFPRAGLFVFKDPRLCRLLPIWKRVFEMLGVAPHYLIPVRNPIDVARSLERANKIPNASGQLLWLDYFLSAEHGTRGQKRGFIHYNDLISNWRDAIRQAVEQASVVLPVPSRSAEARAHDFLARGRVSNRVGAAESLPGAHSWIETTYGEALRACAGETPNLDALDEVRSALTLAEAALGPSVAAMEHKLTVELRHRHDLESRVSSLEDQLEVRDDQKRELRDRLTQQRSEARALGQTVELLMRWVLDRTRDADKPASTELRAALAAIEKAEPAAIPQIASTAALLAEKNVQLAGHEKERAARAALVVDAGSKVAAAERNLAGKTNLVAERDRTIADHNRQLESLREQLAHSQEQLRIERARGVSVANERDRLSEQLADQLRGSGDSRIKRMLKGMGL